MELTTNKYITGTLFISAVITGAISVFTPFIIFTNAYNILLTGLIVGFIILFLSIFIKNARVTKILLIIFVGFFVVFLKKFWGHFKQQ